MNLMPGVGAGFGASEPSLEPTDDEDEGRCCCIRMLSIWTATVCAPYAVCVPEEDVQTGCFERLVLRQECANGQLIPV